MGDDDETHLHATFASHLNMDEAFCARLRITIAAGLESASIGVVTTPGTKNPKYICSAAGALLRLSENVRYSFSAGLGRGL
jgi:hypothetical protein